MDELKNNLPAEPAEETAEEDVGEIFRIRRETLKALQDGGQFTEQLVLQEELKNYPIAAVWEEFCARAKLPANEQWMADVLKYERDVLSQRG